MLGEHGLWDHQYGVFPELTHVPLVVSGDDLSGSVNEPMSLLDVHRTVLDIAGAEGSSRGRNLLESTAREEGTLTEYHGMTQWLIDELERRPGGDDLVAEYDTVLRGIVLPPEYYGYETQDGWIEQGEVDQDPKERLSQRVDELDQREIKEEKQDISDEAMDRLEDLGYA